MTKEDLQDLGDVIKEIAEEKESMLSEKGELEELRQDVEEYKEVGVSNSARGFEITWDMKLKMLILCCWKTDLKKISRCAT